MLIEKRRNEALEAFLKGRKVVALFEYDNNDMALARLEDILPEDSHYLVDVPAYVDPEFEKAVQDMTGKEPRYEMPDENLTAGEPEYKTEQGESNKEICLKLREQGLTYAEISKKTGISYGSVYNLLNPKKKTVGHNADRHLCKSCQYRGETSGCDYVVFTDQERVCDPAMCDKYMKGDRLK